MTQYIDSLNEVRNSLRKVSDRDRLLFFGRSSPSDDAAHRLRKEIKNITTTGHDVSLILYDFVTQSGVSYCSDRIMCYQSTIKAIYVGALLEMRPELFAEHREEIHLTIEYSNNDTYKKLRDTYGDEALLVWCNDCGIDASFLDRYYPRRSAKELCILWTRMYAYLESGNAPVELKEWLSRSACSSAKDVLSDRCLIQTKAGWENGLSEDTPYSKDLIYPSELTDKDPYNDECAINDSGIIYTQNGPYLFVIFSDLPYGIYQNYTPENPLNGLTEALYDLRQSFTGAFF
jgi:hypothetical protein